MLLGLGSGAVYAVLALGLVLTHRSSGIVNFAHGAVAMYATYVFVGMNVDGVLLLPLPGPPGRIAVTALPWPGAMAVAVGCAVAVEAAAYWLVFRPLRRHPPLSRVVASVGLMLALESVVTLQYGPDTVSVPAVLPQAPVRVAGIQIPQDRLLLAGVAVVATALLWGTYRYTRFGLASRACAEDETALSLLGWSPERVALMNWVVAGALAAVGGILVGPITGLDPLTFTLLVVPALAAALVGGLASFLVALAAALALGMLESLLGDVQTHLTWLPATGAARALPLLVVIVVASVRGASIPTRTALVVRRLPRVSRPSRTPYPPLLAGVAAVVTLVLTHGEYRLALVSSMIGAVICLSLVVLTGYLGQISLAQMAFAGVGGFGLSRLQQTLGVPFPVDVLVATVIAATVGLAIGLPALRVRGVTLAVATLAGAVAVEALVFENPAVTGGFAGSRVRAPHLFGVDFAPAAPGQEYPRLLFALFALGVLGAAAAAVAAVRRGRLGRRFLAVRANERAAAASGIGVTSAKLGAFAISACLAALGGAMLGWEQQQLSFESFGVFVSLSYLAVAYVGGVGSLVGALLGGALVPNGIVFTWLENVASLGSYQALVTGVLVMVMAVVAPDGLAQQPARVLRHRPRRRAG